jgi:hypothetical protein
MAKIFYWGFGSGVYVITPDGIPCLVPGAKPDKGEPGADNPALKYREGRGKYSASENDIILHISKTRKIIKLTVGKRFNQVQQSVVHQLILENGEDLPLHLENCSPKIHYDVDKYVQAYNIYAEA